MERMVCKLLFNKRKTKSSTSLFMANLYHKTRMTSLPANYSNASIQRLKSLVITPNMGSCQVDGA